MTNRKRADKIIMWKIKKNYGFLLTEAKKTAMLKTVASGVKCMLEKWKSLCEKKPLPWYAITAVDILITGLVLVIFALFHHVIPHAGRPLGSTMGTVQTPAPTYTMSTVQPYGTADVMPSSAATPAPTYAVGDFTGTFPNYDTGVGAIYSYQSDDLKVAITKGYGTNSAYLVADVWVRGMAQA